MLPRCCNLKVNYYLRLKFWENFHLFWCIWYRTLFILNQFPISDIQCGWGNVARRPNIVPFSLAYFTFTVLARGPKFTIVRLRLYIWCMGCPYLKLTLLGSFLPLSLILSYICPLLRVLIFEYWNCIDCWFQIKVLHKNTF